MRRLPNSRLRLLMHSALPPGAPKGPSRLPSTARRPRWRRPARPTTSSARGWARMIPRASTRSSISRVSGTRWRSGEEEATLALLRIAKQLAPESRSFATPVVSRLLQLRRTLPPAWTSQPAAAEALLADVYGRSDAGLVGATLRLREEALSLQEEAHGPRHGKTLVQAVALARSSSALGKHEAAVNAWTLVSQVSTHALGEGHDLVRRAHVERARALRAAGQSGSALPLLLAELDLARKAHRHNPMGSAVLALRNAAEAAAAAHLAVGNAAAARTLYAEVLAGRDSGIVMNKARVMPVRLRLAQAHLAAGDADAAGSEYRTVLDLAAPDLLRPGGVSLADHLARTAHMGLAIIARDRGDIASARRHGELAAELDDHIVGFFSGFGTGGRDVLAAPGESDAASCTASSPRSRCTMPPRVPPRSVPSNWCSTEGCGVRARVRRARA